MSEQFTINSKLKALSWKEPFASLMLYGKIETRTWNTNYRGLVLICASKVGYNPDQNYNICGSYQIARILATLHKNNYQNDACGKAIAIGELIDCRSMLETDEDNCFVKCNPKLFCHIYENVKSIEPIPWKGQQGWKNVSEEIKKLIKFK